VFSTCFDALFLHIVAQPLAIHGLERGMEEIYVLRAIWGFAKLSRFWAAGEVLVG
jgi:hypothetical protein